MSAARWLAAALIAALPVAAQETRTINPIARPQARAVLPNGAVPVTPPRPVPREKVEAAIATVARAWTDKSLDGLLAKDYQERDRLADALQTKAPRDASLRILGIQGWQVLEQYRLAGAVVSKLAVTVRTQVEFNDPRLGFQARDGTNEYVITLTDEAGR